MRPRSTRDPTGARIAFCNFAQQLDFDRLALVADERDRWGSSIAVLACDSGTKYLLITCGDEWISIRGPEPVVFGPKDRGDARASERSPSCCSGGLPMCDELSGWLRLELK